MEYRREIDGLRTLAVLPVILFHAGFEAFSGGFVGVDVFFVISGYLITKIILTELDAGKFSIIRFYERRARRILPALFTVMLICLVLGYVWLMPDEYKNFGQSLVATTLFSNNILLGITTGYWDMAGEFKPLLHTWSLGVEEQYYVIVPILLMWFWRIGKDSILYLIWIMVLTSFIFSNWFVNVSSTWAFYILPTRAWEIGVGALAMIYIRRHPSLGANGKLSDVLAFAGLLLVLISIFTYDETIKSPGYFLLAPTLGAVLIIMFCRSGSIVYKLLANKIAVFLGLISYSLYLWHQPVFAFFRAYSRQQPIPMEFLSLVPLIFLLSVLTWRFIEAPFRSGSFIRRNNVFLLSLLIGGFFVGVGLYLNKNYGLPQRVYDSSILIGDMDKRIYNEKIYAFKRDEYKENSGAKILIVGNSFARDFVNITLENFDIDGVQVIYRDDFLQCINLTSNKIAGNLFYSADVIVFASGDVDRKCYLQDISFAIENKKQIYYVGTKDFGYNLNWLIRLDADGRRSQFNTISNRIISNNNEMKAIIPAKHFISILDHSLVNGRMPVTDNLGRMLSTDRTHLTKYGALYFGSRIFQGSAYPDLFK